MGRRSPGSPRRRNASTTPNVPDDLSLAATDRTIEPWQIRRHSKRATDCLVQCLRWIGNGGLSARGPPLAAVRPVKRTARWILLRIQAALFMQLGLSKEPTTVLPWRRAPSPGRRRPSAERQMSSAGRPPSLDFQASLHGRVELADVLERPDLSGGEGPARAGRDGPRIEAGRRRCRRVGEGIVVDPPDAVTGGDRQPRGAELHTLYFHRVGHGRALRPGRRRARDCGRDHQPRQHEQSGAHSEARQRASVA